jgi:hypothetical protein
LCRGVMRCPHSKCPRMPSGVMPYQVPKSIRRATIGRITSLDRSYYIRLAACLLSGSVELRGWQYRQTQSIMRSRRNRIM